MNTSASQPIRREDGSRRGSTSLAAAATLNAADRSPRTSLSTQNRGSPRLDQASSDRRRSLVSSTLNLNDPTRPGPGEMATPDHRTSLGHVFSATSPTSIGGRTTIATGDPHHQRQPSLGDIHNELEQEQEAQVNRMLHMIRAQQQQLETLQRSPGDGQHNTSNSHNHGTYSTAIVDEPTPGSERSFSFPHRPHSTSRNSSRTNQSPSLRPQRSQEGHQALHSSAEWAMPPSPSPLVESAQHRRNSTRDESAYYQAETANLTRENQMLKLRIRELEKQLADSVGGPASSHSNLVHSTSSSGQAAEGET